MKFIINTFILLCLMMLSSSNYSFAQAQRVQFAVNMKHANLEPGDKVVVRGNRARLGNWKEEGQLELRQANNQNIYRGGIRLNTQDEILFKFVLIKADGTEVWEESGNREYDPMLNTPVWFSDRSTPGISQTFVNVTFKLDLTQLTLDGLPVERVAIMGAHEPLSFDIEAGRTEMTEVQEGIWEANVGFAYGTPHDVPFKFAWFHEGEWQWEWRPGHTNHVFWLDERATEQTIALNYDLSIPGIIPAENTTGMVDEYENIIAMMGARGAKSRYVYELAMQQLQNGDRATAAASYAIYKQAHPGGEEIDDFDYQMSYHLEKNEGLGAAQRFVERKIEQEANAERRSYLKYLRGELALRSGNHVQARKLLREAMKESAWDIADEYSRSALVQSYLQDTNTDSVQTGLRMLRRMVARAPQGKRRAYATRLARTYERLDMPQKQEEILTELANRGNARQQIKGKLELANYYIKHSRYTEAVGLLDAIEFSTKVPDRISVQITRQRLRAYYELEMYAELATLYEQYARQWPDDPYQVRLQSIHAKALDKLGRLPSEETQMSTMPTDSTQN